MRVELLLFFCLTCLAFTAQAAPASAKDALLAQTLKQRSNDDRPNDSKHDPPHHQQRHHHREDREHHEHHEHHGRHHRKQRVDHSNNVTGHLKNRDVIQGARGAEEAATHLLQPHAQEDLLANARSRFAALQKAGRERVLSKQHEIEIEDAIHVAKYGKTPPKFPAITRVASAIGLTAAVMNTVNFLFSAKTTALATTQFSAPPNPPTFIDTAAMWDGNQYRLMTLPEEKAVASGGSAKQKRSLPKQPSTQRLQKRQFGVKPVAVAEPGQLSHFTKRETSNDARTAGERGAGAVDPKLVKRWAIAAGTGFVLGGLVAPEFISTVRGKKPEVEKPPFDPYDPNVLKPKGPFTAAAATSDQPLPAVPLFQLSAAPAAGAPPDVSNIKFPGIVYNDPATSYVPSHSVTNPASRQDLAASPASAAGSDAGASQSSQVSPVLRKRADVPNARSASDNSDATSSSKLDKRFLFSGGPWSKFAGFVTVGSVVPLLYEGVTHARFRTQNPRDRDILKELDDKPTYGAVGVPGRTPGQLATNAMPGYSDYVKQLEQQQAQRQSAAPPNEMQAGQSAQPAVAADASTGAGASEGGNGGGGGDPVLRRRDLESNGQTRVERRGWLLGGALVAGGALLGYAQSATQFPTDRDAEKEDKKREAKKKQQEMMAAQQAQQGAAPPAGPGYADASQVAATNNIPGPADTSALGAAYPVAAGGGGSSSSYGYGGGLGAASSYTYGGSSGSSPSYGLGSRTSSSYTTNPASSYGGSTSSLASSLNAAAGLQGSSASGGSVLKKRDLSPLDRNLQAGSLSKRTPGWGSALSIGGTTMFFGTLAANVWVGSKQKSKPVPLVTPNANTRGPMIPGGDLYTQYLESKRPLAAGGMSYGAPGSGAAPAVVNYGKPVSVAAKPGTGGALAGTPGATPGGPPGGGPGGGVPPSAQGGGVDAGSDASSDDPNSGMVGDKDPVLKKRGVASVLQKRTPQGAAAVAAVETEAPFFARLAASLAARLRGGAAASEAATGATAALGRGAASEGSIGAAARAGEYTPYSRLYSTAGGGLTRETAASEGAWGASRFSTLASSPMTRAEAGLANSVYRPYGSAMGEARPAMAADVKAATGTAGTPATVEGAAADAGQEAAAAGKSKGMTGTRAMEIVGAGAGATMLMPGTG